MTHLVLNPVGGYVFVALVAVVLLGLLFVGPDRARISGRRRAALAGVRSLVVLLILIAMLRPELVVTETKKQSATLVLLIDRSRSMQVADVLGDKTRWQALRGLLNDAFPLLNDLQEDLELKVYTFDSGVQPVDLSGDRFELDNAPDGEQTAIGAAIEEALQREAGKKLAGVILLSDGAQRAYAPNDTLPQTAARQLADRGFPLYTLVFGQARGLGQARDVAVKNFISNPTVFVKNQLDVSGMLTVDGYPNKNVPVHLLFETSPGEMEVVDTIEVLPRADGEQLPVAMSYVPEVPGEYKVTLRAAPQDGELVTTNNELSTFVTVLKGGINVLYLEGALRVEQRFLQSAIDGSPDIKLDFERFDHRKFTRAPIDAGDRFDVGKYDVYIIGDLDASVWRDQAAWKELADRVERGAGLMMLGGFHSFGPGGYYDTPLRDVLPVVMGKLERQRFQDAIRQDLHLKGPLAMRPARPLGLGHPVMYLAAGNENEKLWNQLPPLDGANRFERVKPNAVVLAASDGARPWPLLVAGGWGAGRVLAFAGDSTWRWSLEGHATEHRRFWRQVVLWLARKDASTEGNVWVKLDARRFRPGARIGFTVGADSPEGEPVADAQFKAEVILPGGERRQVRLARQGETVSGSFLSPQTSGDYTVVVSATQAGAAIGTARARFLIFEQDLELDNPTPNPGLMSTLAAMTSADGGKALAAEEFAALLTELREKPLEQEIEHQSKHTYWDTWPFLLLFVALIGTEWYLRKRWGLV